MVNEFAPSQVIFGMDEPGYLIADLSSAQSESARFEESKQAAPQLTMQMIEDPQVKNKVCCSIVPF